MLKSFACLSGLYGIANWIFVKRNKKFVNQNIIVTLRGKREININRINTSNGHNIYWLDDKECMLHNYRFCIFDDYYVSNNDKILLKDFDSVDDCKQFCIEQNLNFDRNSYEIIKIESLDRSNDNRIWILYGNGKYTVITKISGKKEFDIFFKC